MEEVTEKRAFVLDDSEETFYISPPTGEDIRQADWHYARMFNKALSDGFLTSSEIMSQLKSRGVVSESHDHELSDLQTKITQKLLILESLPIDSIDQRRDLAIEISKLRGEIYEINHRVNGPLSNSCENLAEDARLSYLTSKLIVNGDDNPLWDDFDSYQLDRRSKLISKAKFEVMLWLQGLPSDFLSNLPENKVIMEARQRLMENIARTMDLGSEVADVSEDEQPDSVSTEVLNDQTVPVVEDKPKKKRRSKKDKNLDDTDKEVLSPAADDNVKPE